MSNSNKSFHVAIDGPVGAGKSTVAFMVAQKLGFLFIDTGAMYRSVALGVLRAKGLELSVFDTVKELWNDEELVSSMVGELEIELEKPTIDDGRKVSVFLNGEDVSWDIRSDEIAEGASIVSQYPVVREVLVLEQQLMASSENVVMEGRDIGTRVLPQAQLKIYLDADVDERVRRKQKQLKAIGAKPKLEDVKKALETRDQREMNRKVDPLRVAEGAWVFDTSGLTIEEVVSRICDRVSTLMSNE